MTSYVNPTTGHQEEVSDAATWIYAFLFGTFYFMFKGVWRHVLVQLVLIVLLYALFGAPGTMFVFVMWVVYAFCAKTIIENHLARQGYRHAPSASTTPFNPSGLTHAAPRPAPAQTPAPRQPVRACPFCAEEILAAARKCKHCGSEVEPIASPTAEPQPAAAPPELGSSSPVPRPPPD